MWKGSDRLTDPILDQVLVDTGPLPAGVQSVTLSGASTVAAIFELQHRNALNTANIVGHTQILAVPASGTDKLPEYIFSVQEGERVRAIIVAAVVGKVSVSLNYTG